MRINRILVLIFVLGLFLRIYRLNSFPSGFHVDEAKVAWNAYSFLKTGHDDRGNGLTFYYNSFGDYRLTGIIYSAIIPILIFGKNEFAVRFASSFIGALSVFPVFFLSTILLPGDKKMKKTYGYLSAFFLSTSIWHISVSRATNEVVMGIFFAVWGLYFFISGINLKKNNFLFFSLVLFSFSFLFYHSIRVLIPPFILAILFVKRGEIKKNFRPVILISVLVFLVSVFLIFNAQGLGRFSQTSIFVDKNTNEDIQRTQKEDLLENKKIGFYDSKEFLYFLSFLKEYSNYFSGGFLIGDMALPLRYTTPNVGLLSFFDFFLFAFGLLLFLKDRKHYSLLLLLLLLLISPIAPSITKEDTPNLNRDLFQLIFIIIFMAFSSGYLIKKFGTRALIIILIFSFVNVKVFWDSYAAHSKYVISQVRNYGMKELSIYLDQVHGKYERVILTGNPDSPYPWMAFFNDYDPISFNKVIIKRDKGDVFFQNYVFTLDRCPSDKIGKGQILEDVLYVDAGGLCGEESKQRDKINATLLEDIKRPDGSVAFTLWEQRK